MNNCQKYFDDLKSWGAVCVDSKFILTCVDKEGRTLLHWAAFLGRYDVMVNLLAMGADVNIANERDENFQAIHFAAVNNHIDCIRTLLDYGANIDSYDMFRRTPLCVAAFYGRVCACVFLMQQGASIEQRDMNGNNCLHFAALSGNADLCQILIYSGITVSLTNDLGETPLIIASRRGNRRLLKALLADGPDSLLHMDYKGLNALTHARLNRNNSGFAFLQNEHQKRRWLRPVRLKDMMYGRGASRWPLAFVIVILYGWGLSFYATNIVPLTFTDWPVMNCIFIGTGLIATVCLYAVNGFDPGTLPRCTREYDAILRGLSSRDLTETEMITTFGRLCHTCRTVCPLRAAHCTLCRRCVRQRDHHCPYVNNCIGFRNRMFFLLFLASIWLLLLMATGFTAILYFQYAFRFRIHEYFGICLLVLFDGFVSLILYGTLCAAVSNLTTMESIKWRQYGYEYLRDSNGKLRNPFHKGRILNFLEYFRISFEPSVRSALPLDI